MKKVLLTALYTLAPMFFFQSQAQVTIQVEVIGEGTTIGDCDSGVFGIGDSDSDPIWMADCQDIPDIDGSGFGLLWAGSHEQSETNGPIGAPTSPLATFQIFNHAYGCDGICFPTGIDVQWKGCENDGPISDPNTAICDGGTGTLTSPIPFTGFTALPFPAVNSFTSTTTLSANSGGGCIGDYFIDVRVTISGTFLPPAPDMIADAITIPVGGGPIQYAWCGNQTFETDEPYGIAPSSAPTDISNGTVWFKFTAPASGSVFINTDLANTDIGTRFIIYHDASGNYTGGNLCNTIFDYLSYRNWANTGGLLGTGSQADLEMDCSNLLAGSDGIIPGEVYYIQVAADDPNVCGVIQIEVTDDGGSGAPVYDVPCGASNVILNTTAVSDAAGSTPTISLNKDCTQDDEIDNNEAHAYDYNETLINNNADASVWASFTAPASGSVSIETNCALSGEFLMLYLPDQCIAPAIPSEYNCVDLTFNATLGDDGGIGSTAIRTFSCLEPGYKYYVMVDPDNINLCGSMDIWMFDPLLPKPANDVLCQAINNPAYEIPVAPIGGTGTIINGDNTNACREDLAGEPLRGIAGATVWYYFTAPSSGVVNLNMEVGTINNVSYAVFESNAESVGGTGCYGGTDGTSGTTFTTSQSNDVTISPLFASYATNNQSNTICCLQPNASYFIQVDGTTASSIGDFGISIEEQDIQSGNIVIENTSNYVCYGDYVTLQTAGEILPSCMTNGIIVHDQGVTPTTAGILAGTVYETTGGNVNTINIVNNGTGGYPTNTPIYASALVDGNADAGNDFGDLCPSMQLSNGVSFVFLSPITFGITTTNICNGSITIDGGLPAYNNAFGYTWEISGPLPSGVVISSGSGIGALTPLNFSVPENGTYLVSVSDTTLKNGGRCIYTTTVDFTNCAGTVICAADGGGINGVGSTILCQGQSVSFLPDGTQSVPAGGSYSYVVTDATSTQIKKVIAGSIINDGSLPAGNYCVHGIAADAGGISLSADSLVANVIGTCFDVSDNCKSLTLLAPIDGAIDVYCPGGTAGGSTLDINAITGGLPGATFPYIAHLTGITSFAVGVDLLAAVNPGDNADVFTVIENGTYSVELIDGNGCSRTYDFIADNCETFVLSLLQHNFLGYKNQNNAHVLEWEVENNELVKSFELLSSSNGIQFETIYNSNSKSGFGKISYQYENYKYSENITYYKLKIIENNATETYSNIIAIQEALQFENWTAQVYPNPAYDIVNFEIIGHNTKSNTQWQLISTDGKVLIEEATKDNSSKVTIPLEGVAKGMYFIKIQHSNTSKIFKVVVN